ncbi:MAG TPA: 50S ribosomal protein L22 [Candidatus Paceibacterota bacterium]
MKAILRNYRQSPRKVALAAGLVRGKTVQNALTQLAFTVKRASSPVATLIRSAAANAEAQGVSDVGSLIVKEIRVDKGIVLKRMMPRARGSASRINKRSSHVMVVLGEAIAKKGKRAVVAAPAEAKPAKAAPKKRATKAKAE